MSPAEIVLVPGIGLDEAAWHPAAEAVRAALPGCRVRTVLLPGYGEPAGRSADLRPATLARVLLDRLPDPSGPDPSGPGTGTVLAGHSASCQVVAHAAVLAPARVAGLFLVGPTTDPRARGWARLAGRWLATAAYERPGQVPSLARQYRRTGLTAMARAMDAARRDSLEDTLGAARCPVTVVRGRHDRICPESWAGRLGSVVTLAAGAHMVPITHGELVAAALAHRVATA